MLTKSKLNSRLFSISRTDWHGNKWERIYYDFEGKIQLWENERKYEEYEWEIRRKSGKHEIKQREFKKLKTK